MNTDVGRIRRRAGRAGRKWLTAARSGRGKRAIVASSLVSAVLGAAVLAVTAVVTVLGLLSWRGVAFAATIGLLALLTAGALVSTLLLIIAADSIRQLASLKAGFAGARAELTSAVADQRRHAVAIMEQLLTEQEQREVQGASIGTLLDQLTADGSDGRAAGRSVPGLYKRIAALQENTAALHTLRGILDGHPPLPPLGGWAASADFIAHCLRLISERHYSDVLELGSGSSTVMMAAALRRNGKGHVTALEHEGHYVDSTRRLLASMGLEEWATVISAPLTTVKVHGEDMPWYDLAGLDAESRWDLVVVDGPPRTVGAQARYPALPLLFGQLSDRAVMLLDDANRADEQAVLERWQREHSGIDVCLVDHEKGTAEIRVAHG